MLFRSEVDPTSASAFEHASRKPFVLSVGLSLESHCSTCTCRQPRPPAAFTALAQAFVPSIEPWNRPGANSDPTSAITTTVIVSAETPVSVAFSATPAHGSALAAVVVGASVVGADVVAGVVSNDPPILDFGGTAVSLAPAPPVVATAVVATAALVGAEVADAAAVVATAAVVTGDESDDFESRPHAATMTDNAHAAPTHLCCAISNPPVFGKHLRRGQS